MTTLRAWQLPILAPMRCMACPEAHRVARLGDALDSKSGGRKAWLSGRPALCWPDAAFGGPKAMARIEPDDQQCDAADACDVGRVGSRRDADVRGAPRRAECHGRDLQPAELLLQRPRVHVLHRRFVPLHRSRVHLLQRALVLLQRPEMRFLHRRLLLLHWPRVHVLQGALVLLQGPEMRFLHRRFVLLHGPRVRARLRGVIPLCGSQMQVQRAVVRCRNVRQHPVGRRASAGDSREY